MLEQVARGTISVAEAQRMLGKTADCDLGFAKVDLDRLRRCSVPEVVYCPGKTGVQIAKVLRALNDAGQPALATRASAAQYEETRRHITKAVFHETARAITVPLDNPPRRLAV